MVVYILRDTKTNLIRGIYQTEKAAEANRNDWEATEVQPWSVQGLLCCPKCLKGPVTVVLPAVGSTVFYSCHDCGLVS